MSDAPAPRKGTIGIGLAASAAGLFLVLIGVGLLPISGGDTPPWVVLCAGLVFFLGGASVILQEVGGANRQGELPTQAPFWMRAAQYLIGVATFASFAAIGSWVALGAGETLSTIARTAFGIGAIILWLAAVAFAASGARKLFGSSVSDPH
jgi:hypothetical protein